MRNNIWYVTAVAAIVLGSAHDTRAQNDHLLCYKTKDPLALKGIVDFNSPQFGALNGCKIGKSRLFCVYGTKTVVQAFDKKTPIDPLEVTGDPQNDDRICYKIKCVSPDALQEVSDQFGNRIITRRKTAVICTPAVKGPPPTTTTTMGGCTLPSDCPGVDTECQTRTCMGGVCGFSFTPAGTLVAMQTPGDCKKNVCDGAGGTTIVTDDTDTPADDGNQCTSEVCNMGTPSHPPVPNNTPCSQFGGTICISGACVPQTFTLSVNKSGAGTGTVTSSPAGINCGVDCSENYNSGTMVTLSALTGMGSNFAGWSGGGCSGTGACVVTVNSAVTVTATFVPQQFTLSVSKGGLGTGTVTSSPAGINCGGDCSEPYDNNTVVTLTASPDGGSSFGGWSGGGCSGTGACIVTVNAPTTVNAIFNSP